LKSSVSWWDAKENEDGYQDSSCWSRTTGHQEHRGNTLFVGRNHYFKSIWSLLVAQACCNILYEKVWKSFWYFIIINLILWDSKLMLQLWHILSIKFLWQDEEVQNIVLILRTLLKFLEKLQGTMAKDYVAAVLSSR